MRYNWAEFIQPNYHLRYLRFVSEIVLISLKNSDDIN